MSILDKDPHPFRLPKNPSSQDSLESAQNLEKKAKEEFTDIYTLLAIGKMVAFNEEQNSGISEGSLQESLQILQSELTQREKYKNTEVLKERLTILTYYRDLYASKISGHYEETESGENILVFDDSLYDPLDKKTKKVIYQSTSFELALSPQFSIKHIEKEIQKRTVLRLHSEIDIDEVNMFGTSPPLPPGYGTLNEGEFNLLIHGPVQAKSSQNTDGLGK